jgi:hypothetical protein
LHRGNSEIYIPYGTSFHEGELAFGLEVSAKKCIEMLSKTQLSLLVLMIMETKHSMRNKCVQNAFGAKPQHPIIAEL